MSCRFVALSALFFWAGLAAGAVGGETRFSQTLSRSDYVHWIELYDANGGLIDPTDPKAAPYSPVHTCGKCHDYEAIGHGYHFNAINRSVAAGRAGEPWIWCDDRTGTQIPLSYRNWPGTFSPAGLGITEWDFVLKFGRHLPGGGPGNGPAVTTGSQEGAESDKKDAKDPLAVAGRWRLSGQLAIDCMICHTNDRSYSPEVRWEQINSQNFAWASTAALGLGRVEGKVSELRDDVDPTSDDGKAKLPKTTYAPHRVNAEKKVFFDVVRTPKDNTCYYCHTTRLAGACVAPEWTHDEDVHLLAGMSCSDCHRNDLEHHTVRGFAGETHPTGHPVHTLSCQGCHMDETEAGRLGAPRPLHIGLPPLHFEKLSCTACHSGPRPNGEAMRVLTSMAHGLGLPSHEYSEEMVPGIASPVFLRDGETLYPHRMVWPAYWGKLEDGQIAPLPPEEVYNALRRTLRVRRGSTFTEAVSDVRMTAEDKAKVLGEERAKVSEAELTDEEKAKLEPLRAALATESFRKKLAEALGELKKIVTQEGSQPVHVAGGRAYRLNDQGAAETFEHDAARPYAWRFGHDVRPAQDSAGITGCFECHTTDSPYITSTVTALGPAPDDQPPTLAMHQLAGYDKIMLDVWNLSFQGRTAFKWFGFASMGVLGLVLLAYGSRGVVALARYVQRQ